MTTGYPSTGFPLPWTANDVNPQAALGQIIAGDDGAEFIYVKAGAANIVAGQVQQSAAEVTGNENLAVAATAIGSTTILTTTTVTVTQNQYVGGYVIVTVTPGLANKYRIASHPATTSAALLITLEDPVLVALNTSSRIDLIANPYNGVIVNAVTGSATGTIVGVAIGPITAAQYGWLQTKGVCPCTNDAAGALTVDQELTASASVAGSVRVATAGLPVIGRALSGIAASEVGAVYLTIQ